MSFFKQFPLTNYNIDSTRESNTIIDLFRHVDVNDVLSDDLISYRYYEVGEDERPDIVSQKLYGSSDYYWTFFIINESLKSGIDAWPAGRLTRNRTLDLEYKNKGAFTIIPSTASSITDFAGNVETIESITNSMGGIDFSYAKNKVKAVRNEKYASIFGYNNDLFQLIVGEPYTNSPRGLVNIPSAKTSFFAGDPGEHGIQFAFNSAANITELGEPGGQISQDKFKFIESLGQKQTTGFTDYYPGVLDENKSDFAYFGSENSPLEFWESNNSGFTFFKEGTAATTAGFTFFPQGGDGPMHPSRLTQNFANEIGNNGIEVELEFAFDNASVGRYLYPDGPVNISNISKADPPVITTSGDHNLVSKQIVSISNVSGMTQINGKRGFAKVLTDNTFEFYKDRELETNYNTEGSDFSTYISGGIVHDGTHKIQQLFSIGKDPWGGTFFHVYYKSASGDAIATGTNGQFFVSMALNNPNYWPEDHPNYGTPFSGYFITAGTNINKIAQNRCYFKIKCDANKNKIEPNTKYNVKVTYKDEGNGRQLKFFLNGEEQVVLPDSTSARNFPGQPIVAQNYASTRGGKPTRVYDGKPLEFDRNIDPDNYIRPYTGSLNLGVGGGSTYNTDWAVYPMRGKFYYAKLVSNEKTIAEYKFDNPNFPQPEDDIGQEYFKKGTMGTSDRNQFFPKNKDDGGIDGAEFPVDFQAKVFPPGYMLEDVSGNGRHLHFSFRNNGNRPGGEFNSPRLMWENNFGPSVFPDLVERKLDNLVSTDGSPSAAATIWSGDNGVNISYIATKKYSDLSNAPAYYTLNGDSPNGTLINAWEANTNGTLDTFTSYAQQFDNEQDEKRKIKVIKPEIIEEFVSEFKRILKI